GVLPDQALSPPADRSAGHSERDAGKPRGTRRRFTRHLRHGVIVSTPRLCPQHLWCSAIGLRTASWLPHTDTPDAVTSHDAARSHSVDPTPRSPHMSRAVAVTRLAATPPRRAPA